jgi:hypothetical protein
MACPWKKLKHQGKAIANNQQQMNVATNEEEIEVEQIIIIHIHTFKGKP